MLSKLLCIVVCMSGLFYSLDAAVAITGTVKDQAGSPVMGAIVSLSAAGLTAESDKNGAYSLGGTVLAMSPIEAIPDFQSPRIASNSLLFNVRGHGAHIRTEVYDCPGRLVRIMLDKTLTNGFYRISLFDEGLPRKMYMLKVRIGDEVTVLRMPLVNHTPRSLSGLAMSDAAKSNSSLAKASASVDSLVAWAVGYNVTRLGIDNATGVYDLTLQKTVPTGQVQVLQTSEAGDVLAAKPTLTFVNDDATTLPAATITPSVTYQSVVGFGAAFTETATYNLGTMPAAKKAEILNAFFNPYTGSGYTLCRATINSCDFSLASYSYDDSPGDYTLANFAIQHDQQWMIPAIKAALSIPGASFKVFGSPWSPPAWMKTTNTMLGVGNGQLKSDSFNAWALYFVKYITAMKDNGIPVWGLTMQNEPAYAPTWEGCLYTPEQERDFLKNYLGPTLAKNNIDVKVMIWDHNKDAIVNWARVILGDTAAAKYAWGTAYHRYAGDLFDSLQVTHNLFPQYPMVATECSVRDTWAEAERMAHEILGDLNHFSGGYLTWNLLTNLAGGPYHDRDNGCVGPIVVDSATALVKYNSNYYYMTHFSRYLRPGAVRIGCAYNGSGLEITAVKNTDGTMVVVALNETANPISFKIKQGTQIVEPTIPAHALADFIY
jgi:glucosylceramidase